MTFVSYPDTESWPEKIGTCENDFRINLEQPFTKKIKKKCNMQKLAHEPLMRDLTFTEADIKWKSLAKT